MWVTVGDESGWMIVWACERLGVTMRACGWENEKRSNKQMNYLINHLPHTVSDMDPGEWVNM